MPELDQHLAAAASGDQVGDLLLRRDREGFRLLGRQAEHGPIVFRTSGGRRRTRQRGRRRRQQETGQVFCDVAEGQDEEVLAAAERPRVPGGGLHWRISVSPVSDRRIEPRLCLNFGRYRLNIATI